MSQIGGALEKRVEDLQARGRKNPFFADCCRRYFSLEFALEQARRHCRNTGRYPEGDPFKVSYGFAFAAQSLYANLESQARNRFSGCLQDGIRGDYGLRPVAYEILILMHLCRRDFDVECMDMSGKANFDFLATRLGEELEIECKTAAPDAGLKVHFDEVASLGGYLLPMSRRLVEAGGHHLIRIQVPNRLQATEATMKAVASLVETAVLGGHAARGEVATVEYRCPAASAHLSASVVEEQARTMFRVEFGVEPGTILIHGSASGSGFVAVTIQSMKQDSVTDALSKHAKEAAKQCSGTRAAIIAIQLFEVSPQMLRDAVDGPSRLYGIADAVFKSPNRKHVNSVVFTIPPVLARGASAGVAEATGPVAIIRNPEPGFPSATASSLFTPSDRSLVVGSQAQPERRSLLG